MFYFLLFFLNFIVACFQAGFCYVALTDLVPFKPGFLKFKAILPQPSKLTTPSYFLTAFCG